MFFTSNISFSLQFTNGPNKLECYITLEWKGKPGSNTLAYFVSVSVVNVAPGSVLTTFHFLSNL